MLVLIADRILFVVCSADNVRAGAEDSTSVDVSYEDSTTTAAGLSELLDVSVPSQLDVSAQLRDVLLLLRLLEALNRYTSNIIVLFKGCRTPGLIIIAARWLSWELVGKQDLHVILFGAICKV